MMADVQQFEQELEEALSSREGELQETVLPALKLCYTRMQSAYEALYNVMRKKGLIKADPYNYEERITKITIPSDENFLDSDRDKEMSVRTAQYMAQLEFITNYYDFSLEHLDLRELKQLVKYTRYINWQNLSETVNQPTTRALAEQVKKVKKGSDQLSANIVADAQEQLASASREALDLLKKITAFQRERYKAAVRHGVMPAAGVSPENMPQEEAVRKIRAAWHPAMKGRPFAQDLILEIIAENSADGGPALRETLLESLQQSVSRKKERKKAGPDLKEVLLEATRSLASSSRSLESVVQKLNDNALILESRKLSFGEMLHAIWNRLRGRDDEGHTYSVEYIDEQTGSRKSEDIHFEEFIGAVSRRARIYNGILSKTGSAWNKLSSTSEEEMLKYVTKDIQEMIVTVRRFESLDTMFRAEIPREQRKRVRGINTEVTAIRDYIQRARKKSHEYVSKYEEIEQLKRLGIDPNH